MAAPLTGDANTDMGLLATISALVSAAATKWLPTLVRALRENGESKLPSDEIAHKRIDANKQAIEGVKEIQHAHALQDATVHATLGTQVSGLKETVGELKNDVATLRRETADGFEQLEGLIRNGSSQR